MMCVIPLPVRLGGIALINPTSTAEEDYIASIQSPDQLKAAIIQQLIV